MNHAQALGESCLEQIKTAHDQANKNKVWMNIYAELVPVSFSCFGFLADGAKAAEWGSIGDEAKDSPSGLHFPYKDLPYFPLEDQVNFLF